MIMIICSLTLLFLIAFFQVWWAASDLGWVVGHSYIVYAPLLSGCTTVLFEVNIMKEIADNLLSGAFIMLFNDPFITSLFVSMSPMQLCKSFDLFYVCLYNYANNSH